MNTTIEDLKKENMLKLYEYRKELYKKPRLKSLFLEVTLKCNARCEHCGSRCGEVKEEELSLDIWKKTLKEISEKYDPRGIQLCVTGGEPLIRKDLFELMKYATDLGFYWGITTNGILIDETMVKNFVDTKLESISISIDGLKETHESFRKVPNSFDKIINGIKLLQKEPSIKCVQVTTVANKKNLNELEDLYKLMLDNDIKYWRVVNCDPIGRAKGNSDILLDKEDYKYLFNFIKEKRKENKIKIDYGCSHYLGINLEKEIRDIYFICMTGLYVGSILSNGDIFVCPNVERRKELIQGNIKTDSFIDVWENKYECFRNEFRTSCSDCKKCSHWKYCGGDSFHTWNFDDNKPNFCIKEIYEEEK